MNNLCYICFNRLDLVKKTLPPLLSIDWDNILIVSDGPRNKEEKVIINKIRLCIKEMVNDLDVNLKFVFRESNMGCRRNIEDGLNTFFSTFSHGWVFEDDILLNNINDFIELRLKNIEGHISLYNHLPCTNFEMLNVTNGQYFIWGWYLNTEACINFKISPNIYTLIKLIRKRGLYKGFRLFNTFINTLLNKVDTWDSIYRCWAILNEIDNHVVGIPLITNIGFDSRATHTPNFEVHPLVKRKYRSMSEWNNVAKKVTPTFLA